MTYTPTGETIRCADGSMYYVAGWLSPLAKVNLASCAARRASAAAGKDRFHGEYGTCRMWTHQSFRTYL